METLDNQSFNQSNTGVPQEVMVEMRAATPWMKFAAILGFIYTAFVVIMALVAIVMGGGYAVIPALVQLAVATVPFFLSLFLWQYASNLKQFTETRSNVNLFTAFVKQKAFWRLWGILTIIFIVLIIIVIAFAATMGASLFGGSPFGF
jgi:hypothetical protein